MSGIRLSPDREFIEQMVSFFYPDPDLHHILEIHISRVNEMNIVNNFMELYPELELYYYPSKLQSMCNDGELSFSSCVNILKQMLRNHNFRVLTKTVKKRSSKEKVLIIHPPL
jgi:hypothetical protein